LVRIGHFYFGLTIFLNFFLTRNPGCVIEDEMQRKGLDPSDPSVDIEPGMVDML